MSDRDPPDPHDAIPRVDIDLLWRSITAPATAQEPAPSANPMLAEVPVACPTCRGAGWYTLAVRVGDPRFGVLQLCDCRQQAIQQQATSRRDARRLARLDALQADLRDDIGSMATATFATFRLDRPLAASVTWCGLTANRARSSPQSGRCPDCPAGLCGAASGLAHGHRANRIGQESPGGRGLVSPARPGRADSGRNHRGVPALFAPGYRRSHD